jgi:hypothetical protein
MTHDSIHGEPPSLRQGQLRRDRKPVRKGSAPAAVVTKRQPADARLPASGTRAPPPMAGLYAGNALEWTSSWYKPYKGNTLKNENTARSTRCKRRGRFQQGGRAQGPQKGNSGVPSLSRDICRVPLC